MITLNDATTSRRDYSGYCEELSNIYFCLAKTTNENIEVAVDIKFGAEVSNLKFSFKNHNSVTHSPKLTSPDGP